MRGLGQAGGQQRIAPGVLPSSAHPWEMLERLDRRPQQICGCLFQHSDPRCQPRHRGAFGTSGTDGAGRQRDAVAKAPTVFS
jgi:hypothetical protein